MASKLMLLSLMQATVGGSSPEFLKEQPIDLAPSGFPYGLLIAVSVALAVLNRRFIFRRRPQPQPPDRAAGRSGVKVLTIVTALMLGSLAGCTYGCFLKRVHYRWDEKVALQQRGETLSVRHDYSERASYGHPHLIYWGGGEPHHRVSFTWQGEKTEWSGPYTPVVLQFKERTAYLVVFDRETSRGRFRYFVRSKDWREIQPSEFPKDLAVQNTWLHEANGYVDGEPVNEYALVAALDPDDVFFQRSLTAKIWLHVAKGVEYLDSPSEVDGDFLRSYKQEFLRSESLEKGTSVKVGNP